MTRTAAEFARALAALLPNGTAWQWPAGGLGDDLLNGTAQELARVNAQTAPLIEAAIDAHRPGTAQYLLSDYQAIADDNTVIIPRQPATIGSAIGYRLWSQNAPEAVSPAPVVTLTCNLNPGTIGDTIGTQLWSSRARYYLRIQCDRSLINMPVLIAALTDFKQAHVCLYLADTADLNETP